MVIDERLRPTRAQQDASIEGTETCDPLTPGEYQVPRLLTHGMTSKEVGEALRCDSQHGAQLHAVSPDEAPCQ
jgi:hypothetical protein